MSEHELEPQDTGAPPGHVPTTGRLPEAILEDAEAEAAAAIAAEAARVEAELRAAGNID